MVCKGGGLDKSQGQAEPWSTAAQLRHPDTSHRLPLTVSPALHPCAAPRLPRACSEIPPSVSSL